MHMLIFEICILLHKYSHYVGRDALTRADSVPWIHITRDGGMLFGHWFPPHVPRPVVSFFPSRYIACIRAHAFSISTAILNL